MEHGYPRPYSSNKAAPKRGSELGLPSGTPRMFVSITSFLSIFVKEICPFDTVN